MRRIIVRTPVCPLVAEATERAIVRLSFRGRGEDVRPNALLKRAKREIQAYFSGRLRRFTVPVELEGTEFQRKVWRELARIPFGKTAGYGEIAKRVGKPKAARAVGGACHANPVAVIIPCHRVVGADGSLTGFGGGMSRKDQLLALEGATRPSSRPASSSR